MGTKCSENMAVQVFEAANHQRHISVFSTSMQLIYIWGKITLAFSSFFFQH